MPWWKRRSRRHEVAPVGAVTSEVVPETETVDVDATIREGLALHQRGELEAARRLYQLAEREQPDNPSLRYLLGSLLGQTGALPEARAHLEFAARHLPEAAEVHIDLGHVLRGQGLTGPARSAYERALELEPSSGPARRGLAHLLAGEGDRGGAARHLEILIASGDISIEDRYLAGNLALEADDPATAEAHYRAALALSPDAFELHNNLGVALARQQRTDEALSAHRRAAQLNPGFSDAHYNAGLLEVRAGRVRRALEDFDRALQGMPEFLAARRQRALCLGTLGSVDEALAELDAMLAADPDLERVHLDRGALLVRVGRLDEAEASQRAALVLDPESAEAYCDLGMTLARKGEVEAAAQSLERALSLDPDLAEAHNNLGGVREMQAELEQAIACYRRAVEIAPGRLEWRSNLLAAAHYEPDVEPSEVGLRHEAWAAQLAQSVGPPRDTHSNQADPERRLRVGYLSGDFRTHSVSYFFRPLLEAHDPGSVETFGFSNLERPDAMTARFEGSFAHWHDVSRLSDEETAALVAECTIDVLVDLSGHSAGNRLGVFARRPAPVQVSYLGYPGTTGLAAIDLRISDHVADPPSTRAVDDASHSERLVRLDRCFLAYQPPADAPPVAARPCERGEAARFVSFNELAKVTPEVVRTWSSILAALPDATLMLKATALGDPATARRVEGRFQACGVGSERLTLRGRTASLADHLALYGEADIALDTFPYNGTTTTCEALWMGVPVLTLAGDRHAGRVGASLLQAVGLDELVARGTDDYVARALALAGSPERIASYSGSLRERIQGSPLGDAGALARAVEGAYREAWCAWCAKPG